MNYKYIIINTVFNDRDEALGVVNILLNNKLIACAQLHNVESHYWWKNNIENTKEILVSMRTKKSLFKKIEQIIKENHSYVVPEIIEIPITDGSDSYLNWINEVTIN